MKFSGQFTVPAERPAVFERLLDPLTLANCVDGVRDIEPIDDRNYRAVLETKLAYIRFRFAIDMELTEIDNPSRIVVRAVGSPLGVVGRIVAEAEARLEEREGETVVSYELDMSVAGKLGSIGQPVFRSKAKEMENRFVQKFNETFRQDQFQEASDARF
jgi:carbon monoxide dehydrogenase subunit G